MEFHRILVPVVGSEADDEALTLACKLADRKSRGKISILHVIAVERALPLDAELSPEIEKAEVLLERLENEARAFGCDVESELLQGRDIGQAIVNEAIERESDLILIGTLYKVRFGEFSLGDVVPYVLKNAPCRVIIYQHQSSV